MEQHLTLREALAENRLDDFVRQEEALGIELANGSEFERALALLITKRRTPPLYGQETDLQRRSRVWGGAGHTLRRGRTTIILGPKGDARPSSRTLGREGTSAPTVSERS